MAKFLDKLVVGVSKGVNTVSANSKAMIERAKINTAIDGLEKERTEITQKLGQRVYDMITTDGTVAVEELQGFITEINQRLASIAEQQLELKRVDDELQKAVGGAPVEGGNMCNCGNDNKPEAKFCAKCGTALT